MYGTKFVEKNKAYIFYPIHFAWVLKVLNVMWQYKVLTLECRTSVHILWVVYYLPIPIKWKVFTKI